jgi:hypothetical protein
MGILSEEHLIKKKEGEALRKKKKRPQILERHLRLDAHTKRSGNFFFGRGVIRTQKQTVGRSVSE